MQWLDPAELRIRPPLCDLFPRNDTIVKNIAASMKASGYDEAEPIVYWHGHCVVDGHTRREAAQVAGIAAAVIMRDFADEDEALEYAIRRQVDRRQLKDSEIMRLRRELDRRMTAKEAGQKKGVTDVTPSGRTAQETAELLGTNQGKIAKARTVDDHARPEVRAAVDAGEMSINQAYNLTQDERRYADAVAALRPSEMVSYENWRQREGRPEAMDSLRSWAAMREAAESRLTPGAVVLEDRREVEGAPDFVSLGTPAVVVHAAPVGDDPSGDFRRLCELLTDWMSDNPRAGLTADERHEIGADAAALVAELAAWEGV